MGHFWVTPNDEKRQADFVEIFGSAEVEVTAPFPCAGIEDGKWVASFFLLKVDALTGEQFEKMCQKIADDFGYAVDDVRNRARVEGVPILAGDLTMRTDVNLALWVDDADAPREFRDLLDELREE